MLFGAHLQEFCQGALRLMFERSTAELGGFCADVAAHVHYIQLNGLWVLSMWGGRVKQTGIAICSVGGPMPVNTARHRSPLVTRDRQFQSCPLRQGDAATWQQGSCYPFYRLLQIALVKML